MPLVNLKASPSRTTRRWFGLSLACFLLLLGWLLSHGSASWNLPLAAALGLLAAGLLAIYYAFPNSQLAIIRGWQYLTLPIAWTVGHVLLLATFYLVLWPVGWLLRIGGYDPLRLRDSDAASAWEDREPIDSATRYFKQY